jgi:protocatechuate 3,4-dioxygenase beta subunit
MTGRFADICWWSAGALLVSAATVAVGCGGEDGAKSTTKPTSSAAPKPATSSAQAASAPACRAGDLTPAQTEGPYYKEGSPQRDSLAAGGSPGRRLTLTGTVRNSDCRPIAGAVLQFWQADAAGQYDNSGFKLRGHESTDAGGRYRLQTIIPGRYPGRTPHIHVKVQPPGGAELTTQLYFPDQPSNSGDAIFDPKLLLPMKRAGSGYTAQFDFVVKR